MESPLKLFSPLLLLLLLLVVSSSNNVCTVIDDVITHVDVVCPSYTAYVVFAIRRLYTPIYLSLSLSLSLSVSLSVY